MFCTPAPPLARSSPVEYSRRPALTQMEPPLPAPGAYMFAHDLVATVAPSAIRLPFSDSVDVALTKIAPPPAYPAPQVQC